MSHSKKKARGQSYYLDTVNQAARKYVQICNVCGRKGYDPAAILHEPNVHVIEELRHLYPALPLNHLGQCDVCAAQINNHSTS